MATFSSPNPMARVQREMEFQQTAELINKFIISTTQFLNRFAAVCDSKLLQTTRSLQRLEVLTILLESKLRSIDAEEDGDDEGGAAGGGMPQTNGLQAPTSRRNADGMMSVPGSAAPPPMPGLNAPRAQLALPPPPHSSGPPLPPGMGGVGAGGAAGAGVPSAIVVGGGVASGMPAPPAFPGQAPAGFVPPPPPPMPLLGGFTMRTHPRLKGYFMMAAARVPVSAIKEKMRVDGYNPQYLDTPDEQAPSSIPAKPKETLYDSD